MPVKSTTCFKKDGEPLSTYFSEYEANEGASHVRLQYGLDLAPYQCKKCGNWHLSPKERQTSVKSTTCFKKDGEPLSAYLSEDEANEGASYARLQYGLDLTPYQCQKCGNWHLSPKERQTPSKECAYCIDSQGQKKELYETQQAALTRAEIIKKERGIVLKVYKCRYQNGWHLTKNMEELGPGWR